MVVETLKYGINMKIIRKIIDLKNKFVKKLLGRKFLDEVEVSAVERTLYMVRNEYTTMPRFGFHQPLDFDLDTYPVNFEKPIKLKTEELLIPAPDDRMGYSPENTNKYLDWGLEDKKFLMKHISQNHNIDKSLKILDFGCSSGRVLRHFYDEAKTKNWELYGVDIQAKPIQWMREFLPNDFNVYTGTTMPILPFPDNHFDVIYGFSIFTHIKYNWDMWLMEINRVLKPGGLLIQTVHTEKAWKFYFENKNEQIVKDNHSPEMAKNSKMPYEYFYYGDANCSQIFWKTNIVKSYWGRYFKNVEVTPPPNQQSFQDWLFVKNRFNFLFGVI